MRLRLITSLAISCALLAAPVAATHPTTSDEVARVATTLDSAELRAFVESRHLLAVSPLHRRAGL